MSRHAVSPWILGLGLAALLGGCEDKSFSDRGGSDGPPCSSFCSQFERGDNCDGLDKDACETDCEDLATTRSFCGDLATELVTCLASATYECQGPGYGVATGDDGDPPSLYSASGTLVVEDSDCAPLARQFNDCLYGEIDLSKTQTFEAEGPDMDHQFGEEVDDGWTCRPDLCTYSDHMLYGPYVHGASGAYRATFRMRATCDSASPDPVVSLDVPPTNGYVSLACGALQSSYGDVAVDFDYDGGDLEFRVLYMGTGEVTVDHVRVAPR